MGLEAVEAPAEGVWRVGRSSDPLAASRSEDSEISDPKTGNRFDSPTGDYGIVYFSTQLEGCFGETLSRYRPDAEVRALVAEEWRERGWMNVGDIPAEWRQDRVEVLARFPDRGSRFLDVESAETREALLPHFGALLAHYDYEDLDVPTIRVKDRRISRYISKWAYERESKRGNPLFAGVRYVSRLDSKWECWAVFDRTRIESIRRRPILVTDPALRKIAKRYKLTPH